MGRQLCFDGCCLGMAVCSQSLAGAGNCLFPMGVSLILWELQGRPRSPPTNCRILGGGNTPPLAAPEGPCSALPCSMVAPSP